MTARVAWFHCFSGIAGDMALGALLDAGADQKTVEAILDGLAVSGWRLETEKVLRGGLAGTRAHVIVDGSDQKERAYRDIAKLIADADLPGRVRERALAIFTRLGEAEARLHGTTLADVHFHEVGGHDAIVDIVGVCAALESLEVDDVCSSPVAQGLGSVRSAHGLLPNPAPAVLELLRDAPVYGREVSVELTTPTGAAILAGLSSGFGPMPALRISAIGYGAGGREIDGLPNLTQVVIGERAIVSSAPDGHPLYVLEANLDDATGEQLGDAMRALLDAGAADAWITPVLMKKGRPGHVVSVLAEPSRIEALREILLAQTGSFGLRAHLVDRYAEQRSSSTVSINEVEIGIKASPHRIKAEHDDALVLAQRLGISVREAQARAEAVWRESHPEQPEA